MLSRLSAASSACSDAVSVPAESQVAPGERREAGGSRRFGFLRRCKKLGLAALAGALTLFGSPVRAHAACLGLNVPPPADANVCRILVESLVVPQFTTVCKPRTSLECLALPQCCLPACLGQPLCTIFVQADSLIFHAGDLYCGPQEISASEMVDAFVTERFADYTALQTGGVTSLAYTMVGAHVDVIECQAAAVPSQLKDVLKSFAAIPGKPNTLYTNTDVENVRFIRKSAPSASLYLPGARQAITLGTLVILRDQFASTIAGWNRTWDDVRWGRLSAAEREVLMLFAHELVHVRQLREVGRDAFYNRYLAEVLALGYASTSFEQEAFGVANSLTPLDRGPWLNGRYWGEIGNTAAQTNITFSFL